jgi:hypothetical protein
MKEEMRVVWSCSKPLKAEKENYQKALMNFKEFANSKQIKQRIKSINSLLFHATGARLKFKPV